MFWSRKAAVGPDASYERIIASHIVRVALEGMEASPMPEVWAVQGGSVRCVVRLHGEQDDFTIYPDEMKSKTPGELVRHVRGKHERSVKHCLEAAERTRLRSALRVAVNEFRRQNAKEPSVIRLDLDTEHVLSWDLAMKKDKIGADFEDKGIRAPGVTYRGIPLEFDAPKLEVA